MDILRALTDEFAATPGISIALRANQDGQLQVVSLGGGVLIVNGSGAIAVGALSQQVFASNARRTFLLIQNPSTETEPLYYEFDAAAQIAGNSPELAPGQAALFDRSVPATSINVIATTLGHRFFAKQSENL